MKLVKLLIFALLITVGLYLTAKVTLASEGTVEIRSTTAEDYRCFVVSLLMQNSSYRVIVSCRDLIYPPRPDLFTYIVWTTPLSGKNPIKLGELGIGKASFETRDAFSSLFVTVEQNKGARKPEGQVVMQGTVQSISFLDRPTTPTPTEKLSEEAEQELLEEAVEPTAREKFVLALRRAGLVIFLALAATIGLVFILTRPKR